MRACVVSVARCTLPVERCTIDPACCMLSVASCMPSVACCTSSVARVTLDVPRCTMNLARCMSPLRSVTWQHVRFPMNKARGTSDVIVPLLAWICCVTSAECCILLRGKYGMLHVALFLGAHSFVTSMMPTSETNVRGSPTWRMSSACESVHSVSTPTALGLVGSPVAEPAGGGR